MTMPTLRLNNGYTMPQIGLGTASLNDDQIAPLIVTAIEAGYRHIDFMLTASEVAAISVLDTGAEKRVDSDISGH